MTTPIKAGDRVRFSVGALGSETELIGVVRRLDKSHLAWSRDLPPDLASIWVEHPIDDNGVYCGKFSGHWTRRVETLIKIEEG